MVSNADPAEVTIGYMGHYVGCGWCGYMAPADQGWKRDCCPKMALWTRQLRDMVAGPDYVEPPPMEDQHIMARWERVARRLEAKHS